MTHATHSPITPPHSNTDVIQYRRISIAAYLFTYIRNRQINGLNFRRSPISPEGVSNIYCNQTKFMICLYCDKTAIFKKKSKKNKLPVNRDSNNTILYFTYHEVLEDVRKVLRKIISITNQQSLSRN